MKIRTWLPDALRLHFEEHVPRAEVAHRLGIPKTTVYDLFALPECRTSALSTPLLSYIIGADSSAVTPTAPWL